MVSAARAPAHIMDLPKLIRVSLGSAIVLGLLKGELDAVPTTAYLLTYRKGRCTANCAFCPQARESRGRSDMLSRISWPTLSTQQVMQGIQRTVEDGQIKRVCLQALNYQQVFRHLLAIVRAICSMIQVPISISCQPLNRDNILRLAEAGAERMCIPLDTATEEIFSKVKGHHVGGPYVWEEQMKLLSQALEIFGRDKVSTHLIVGLGETEKQMADLIQQCVDKGILPALFTFTPIPGTRLENNVQPSLQKYRRIQLVRYLILHRNIKFDQMRFDEKGNIKCFGINKEEISRIIQSGEPFVTSGCPSCNRPYYNEKPSGPIYNYPRPLTRDEIARINQELSID
ncbi:MAG: radical SAM protein, partial [Candidatus Bathyarchaeota archaeon]